MYSELYNKRRGAKISAAQREGISDMLISLNGRMPGEFSKQRRRLQEIDFLIFSIFFIIECCDDHSVTREQ